MNPLKAIPVVLALLCFSFVSELSALDVYRPDITPRYYGAQPNEWTMDYDVALVYAASNCLRNPAGLQ